MAKSVQDPRKVLECRHCGNETLMNAVASYQDEVVDYDDGVQMGASYTCWTTYLCPVCHNATMEEMGWDTYAEDEFGAPLTLAKIIYPETPLGKQGHIPDNVANAFKIAVKARHLDGAICAVALRRTLDTMCKDKGQNKGTLYEKLKELSNSGVLPPIIDQMADVLRELGNAAAHGDEEEFSRSLITNLIEFTETILSYVYTLPYTLNKIQKKLNKAPQKSVE